MKKLRIAAFICILMTLFVTIGAVAQSEQLTLKMSRDWGYGGFHGDIQGLFTMKVTGPADLAKVSFHIDDTVIGEATKAPFNLQFNTDNYPLGVHKLYAVGVSSSGQEYSSNVINAEFVPASSASKSVFPILAVVLGAVVLSAFIPLVLNRKVKNLPMGAERNYGAAGGAVCPRCHRPYPLSFFTPHFGFSKLGICPFCRKVSLVRPESIETLRNAEKAELGGEAMAVPEQSEADKLQKELDDSKYQGF